MLRQDNADIRLTPISHKIGLAGNERIEKVEIKKKGYSKIISYMNNNSAEPESINEYLSEMGSTLISQKLRYSNILSRPGITIEGISKFCPDLAGVIAPFDSETIEQAEILMKYEGYLEREKENAEKIKRLEDLKLSPSFNYDIINSLGTEAREKLKKIRPTSIAQASRISGISPADISVLLVHLGR